MGFLRRKIMNRIMNAYLLAGLVAFAGCSSGVKGTETESVVAEPGGVAILDTYQATVTVVSVDMMKNKITVQTPDGHKSTLKAGKGVDVSAFSAGEQISVEMIEEMAVELIPGGGETGASEAAGIAVAAKGNETDVMTVGTVEITADVTAVDAGAHKVTLKFADGTSKTVKVDKSVDLTKVNVGDSVDAEMTEGIAISATKAS